MTRHRRAVIISSATTVAEARWLAAHGVRRDHRAGPRGRRSPRHVPGPTTSTTQLGTFALVPQIVDAVERAGHRGGRHRRRARASRRRCALGAAARAGRHGVPAAVPEATTSAVHRAALRARRARDTALTNVFTGRPARGIVNRVDARARADDGAAPAFPLAAAAAAARPAERAGSAISRRCGPARPRRWPGRCRPRT